MTTMHCPCCGGRWTIEVYTLDIHQADPFLSLLHYEVQVCWLWGLCPKWFGFLEVGSS